MNRSLVQRVAVALLAAVVVVGVVLVSRDGGEPVEETANAPVRDVYAGIPQDGIRLGDPGAPATIVEIADLQCPFCAQYSVEAMPSVVRDYVRTGKAAYELHLRSFIGRDSVRAAGAAAAAAREDRMYQFADRFFAGQGPENSDYADAAFMREIASQVDGLDPAVIAAAADDPLSLPAVRRAEEFARAIDSEGTPSFYLRRKGSERLEPLSPQGTSPDAYAEAIDAALAELGPL